MIFLCSAGRSTGAALLIYLPGRRGVPCHQQLVLVDVGVEKEGRCLGEVRTCVEIEDFY